MGSRSNVVDGVLVLDKPSGMTSHDVVDVIRRRFGTRRVGHGGTLDPDATGVLLLGIGKATRFLQFAQSAPKRYEAVCRFGVATATQDASGEVTERRDASRITAADVTEAATKFVGDIDQVPPMVSAVRMGGERLYEKARRGEEVERVARRVTVHELTVGDFRSGEEPEAALDVLCSGGTYIRTLVQDLGAALGVGAHLRDLRRTAVGGFTLADATPLDEVTEAALLPLEAVVRDLPTVVVSEAEAVLVSHGRSLPERGGAPEGAPVAIVSDGRLFGVYRRRGGVLQPERVVPR